MVPKWGIQERQVQPATLLHNVIAQDLVQPADLSELLRITQAELAATLGVPRESVSKQSRIATVSVQSRLREMVEILNRVLPWTGSPLGAYAWYRSQTLPSLGDATAESLVRGGQGALVRRYLDRVAAGGFA
jgi:hypothetical protein